MPAGIFISYRRQEALAEARGIYERLRAEFGSDSVFIDLEGLDYGVDFVESLERQLQHCQVMLAVIGPGWVDAADGSGRRRLDDVNDFVRIELRTALQRNIRLVPVLLDGASMPRTADLPADLEPLVRRQKVDLDFARFDSDIGRLLGSLRRILNPAEAPTPAPQTLLGKPKASSGGASGMNLKGLGLAAGLVAVVLLGALWFAQRGKLEPAPSLVPETVAVPAPDPAPVATTPPVVAPPPPLSRFRDCDDDSCPWMVVLPAGSPVMGSPESEPGRYKDEGPQHRVQVASFAIGQYEVTFRQWDACVAAGGCTQKPGDAGWGRGQRPVINVSWDDAQQYVKWLSGKTGQTYRLPSEAEWEYAARAGTTTPFAFGERITTAQANFDGNYSYNGSAQGEYRQKTLPVGSLAKNAWDLYDLHGNVWEWLQDCWHDNYQGAPADGRAWVSNCAADRRLLRGGGWDGYPWVARSAFRYRLGPAHRDSITGFRLARMLP